MAKVRNESSIARRFHSSKAPDFPFPLVPLSDTLSALAEALRVNNEAVVVVEDIDMSAATSSPSQEPPAKSVKRGKYLPHEATMTVREVAALRAQVQIHGNFKTTFELMAQKVNKNTNFLNSVN